jgi:hypothetical protein
MRRSKRHNQLSKTKRLTRSVHLRFELSRWSGVYVQLVKLCMDAHLCPINDVRFTIGWKQYLADIVKDAMIGGVEVGTEICRLKLHRLSIGSVEDVDCTSTERSRQARCDE